MISKLPQKYASLLLLVVVVCTSPSGCPSSNSVTIPRMVLASPPAHFHRGIAAGLYSDLPGLTIKDMLLEIKDLGATHVSFIVSWAQHDVYDTHIEPITENYKDGFKDTNVSTYIDFARSNGLKVFLFPILQVTQRRGDEWRGTLKPRDYEEWWQSYERFILHYATIANRHGVELFCVGSELVAMEEDRVHWQSLIAKVRQIYKGELIYSANWDHYTPVTFWDLVDYVGLNAYHTLSSSDNPSVEELRTAWQKIKNSIMQWLPTVKKPLVFTEIGYPSLNGANKNPWDYTTGTDADPQEQYDCYRAFYEVWAQEPRLGGVYFWNWYGHGGLEDTSYTPRKKPAEQIIRQWYNSHRNFSSGGAAQ